ncbi:MAG: hypothetical protein ACOCSF_08345 [Halanaeroarchaeum sp.]
MSVSHTRLDREFRGDSKHPNQDLSATPSTCDQCGEGLMVYDSTCKESRCQSCDASLRPSRARIDT